MIENIKFYCKFVSIICAWCILTIHAPIFSCLLFSFLMLDIINCGPFSIFYEIQWRYKRWKTNEKEHEWGDWYMIECGMRQIRFCKKCGKMDIR